MIHKNIFLSNHPNLYIYMYIFFLYPETNLEFGMFKQINECSFFYSINRRQTLYKSCECQISPSFVRYSVCCLTNDFNDKTILKRKENVIGRSRENQEVTSKSAAKFRADDIILI